MRTEVVTLCLNQIRWQNSSTIAVVICHRSGEGRNRDTILHRVCNNITQRLLIFGHREPIPMPAPDPSDLHDTRTIVTMVVVCGLLGGWLLLGVIGRIRRLPFKPMRHASSWPRRMRG